MKGKKQRKLAVILLFVAVCGAFYLRIPDSGGKVEALPEGQYASEEKKETGSQTNILNPDETSPDRIYSDGMKEDTKTESDLLESETAKTVGTEQPEDESTVGDAFGKNASAELVVHVCGAVVAEGVYRLPAGSRVVDAVEAAGGFTREAARAYWNQADCVKDGMQIYIPSEEEAKEWKAGTEPPQEIGGSIKAQTPAGEAAQAGDGKLNLNQAGREELMSLPGIGESKAEAILSYREEKGGFGSIEELMEVPGIKEGVFRKIKERITIESR